MITGLATLWPAAAVLDRRRAARLLEPPQAHARPGAQRLERAPAPVAQSRPRSRRPSRRALRRVGRARLVVERPAHAVPPAVVRDLARARSLDPGTAPRPLRVRRRVHRGGGARNRRRRGPARRNRFRSCCTTCTTAIPTRPATRSTTSPSSSGPGSWSRSSARTVRGSRRSRGCSRAAARRPRVALERPGAVGLGRAGGTAIVSQRPEAQVLGVRVRDDVVWGLADPERVDVEAFLDRVGLRALRRPGDVDVVGR